MAQPIRETFEGGCFRPLTNPLSASSQVPSQVTMRRFRGPAMGRSRVPGIGPSVALRGGGSRRDCGRLGAALSGCGGGGKTPDACTLPGYPGGAFGGARPLATDERGIGGRDMLPAASVLAQEDKRWTIGGNSTDKMGMCQSVEWHGRLRPAMRVCGEASMDEEGGSSWD